MLDLKQYITNKMQIYFVGVLIYIGEEIFSGWDCSVLNSEGKNKEIERKFANGRQNSPCAAAPSRREN